MKEALGLIFVSTLLVLIIATGVWFGLHAEVVLSQIAEVWQANSTIRTISYGLGLFALGALGMVIHYLFTGEAGN